MNKWVVEGLEVVLRSDPFITESLSKLLCLNFYSLLLCEILLRDSWEQKTKNSGMSEVGIILKFSCSFGSYETPLLFMFLLFICK